MWQAIILMGAVLSGATSMTPGPHPFADKDECQEYLNEVLATITKLNEDKEDDAKVMMVGNCFELKHKDA